MIMKALKVMVIILLLSSVGIIPMGCSSESEGEIEDKVIVIERGDLLIEITAVGNLELSRKEDLDFDISGTVEEVMVEEGDYVEENEQMAALDTADWEDKISNLEDLLTASERNLKQAQINLENAEYALDKAEEETSTTVTGDIIQREVDSWEIDIKEMQVELARLRLGDSLKAVTDAQEELDEALAESPIIKAPFDGFITRVNVEGGDEVMKGTIAVVLADPAMFEVTLQVSEMDIFKIEIGGEAWVEVDAVSGLTLPATITSISPTAIIQQSLVNYNVKIEVEPLEKVRQELQARREEMMPQDGSTGELPEHLQQAIEEGKLSQEQAEEMMEQRQQGQGQGQMSPTSTIPENFQLKEGLTVRVSIIAEGKEDILLVPNVAITSHGGQSYVRVMSLDGTIEELPITTGISNGQYTEIISGISEGEEVLVSSMPASASSAEMRPPGFVGMGRN
jgi:HlyD family secretion protein